MAAAFNTVVEGADPGGLATGAAVAGAAAVVGAGVRVTPVAGADVMVGGAGGAPSARGAAVAFDGGAAGVRLDAAGTAAGLTVVTG